MAVFFPTHLTLARIALIPVVVGLFYLKKEWGSWLAAGFFAVACFTDYLDGYYARTLRQTTQVGRFLDPIADKLLIASTLLLLVGFDRVRGISLIPALVILCRELLVSGLREFLAQTNIEMPVTQLSKWKTGVQMTALGVLIAGTPSMDFLYVHTLGLILLWCAAILTLVTGYGYFRQGVTHIQRSEVGDRRSERKRA